MNHAVVVDASVGMKWLLTEELSEQARALYETSLNAAVEIAAPGILPAELTNGVFQKYRRRLITAAEADAAVDGLARLSVSLLEPQGLYQAALRSARANNLRAIYDSLYLALADELDAPLWTADRRFVEAVGGAGRVRWLGDYR